MFSFLISFVLATLFTLLILRLSKKYKAALDKDLSGVQKVHAQAVPRVGGLAIYCAAIITGAITMWRLPAIAEPATLLMLCASVAFVGGIVEDFTGAVSVLRRLLLTLLAALLGYLLIEAKVTHVGLNIVDWALKHPLISLPITVFLVAGIANAVNLIDGFNGLASVVSICMLVSLAYVGLQVADPLVVTTALILAGATAGFFVWNYPGGLIFLGDGGAYLLGFSLAELAVLLVARNHEVSPWYAALLLIYPAFETVFSVYRRFYLRKQSPGMPDGIHLHSLIFRRVVRWTVGERDARALTRRNSLTAPYLWLLSLLAVGPATLFWNNTPVLMCFCLLFICSYVWLYARLVRFKAPRWMIIEKREKDL